MRSWLWSLLLLSAFAQGRVVTDHGGYTVAVPDAPQRIVSLHDWTLTVMIHELGAPLAASSGRLAADGSFYMRGARELFGLDFSRLALASVHGKPDLERIRAMKPDLILANSGDYAPLRAQLATLAPTLMFDGEQGRPMLALYQDLAGWLGREAQFQQLLAGYRAELTATRQRLVEQQPVAPSYVALLVNGRDGSLQIVKEYGALTTVLDDLGLRRLPIVSQVPAGRDRMVIGAEWLDVIDADYIVTSYLPEHGDDADSLARDLERIAPGARRFLKAFQYGQVVSLPRYQVYPPSFSGLHLTLQALSMRLSEGKQLQRHGVE